VLFNQLVEQSRYFGGHTAAVDAVEKYAIGQISSELGTAWLPWEGSNSDIPNSVSAFEKSTEFRLERLVFMPGDFSAASQSKWEPGGYREKRIGAVFEHWMAHVAV
jgi:hypothetical protein